MQSTIHRAADLSADERRVLERLLGRALAESESVQVRALRGQVLQEAPTGERRESAYQTLLEHMRNMSSRTESVPEEVLNAEIEEALAEVRRERRSCL